MTDRPSAVSAKVFVRGLAVEAELGVHAHERGRRQPLLIDVELELAWAGATRLADTFNYETVRAEALALANGGHFDLVEAFAEQLGHALMADPRIDLARVKVEKPLALAPDAQGAGVELVLRRP